ncbi:hypothetical protein ES319_D02G068000v1 [Gossypium barbadense]|uniref:Pectinesterase inhibitor domain-containing protein n=3 Tax=Gossypium TaxID=3633 RepID=A0A0D2RGI5_GOSRA|nr:pectinesterase inhibitor [Gossypium raimondii]KAB2040222.1 hypothetical protein ES319_D02G068000v1 [Gossypium barbadense]TYG78599.1 hypothetical protein ES288_D02G072700v1 [Gossypium darwinii]KJB28726.1 hypothetical protein B456_005G066500 [Gossypium raimondii]MBA0585407.1 hypothetical protein [Gossypium raimondii]PPD99623.1 hypothetical protein GOBAR_DD03335 [Gossypium barbadense]
MELTNKKTVLVLLCFRPVLAIYVASAPITASAPVPPPISQPPTVVPSDPQIKSLCAKTEYPDLCLTTIAPFFNGKTDIASVVEMLIKAGTEQTKQANATATKMAADPKYADDPKTISGLKGCYEMYDDALDNMQNAMDAIPVHDIGTIETMVSAAITDYGTCDDGFTRQPNPVPDGVSPMVDINENLQNIGSIILAITDLLH